VPTEYISTQWVGTNLIHDFTAVTFSVKLAFFCEKRPFPYFREIRDLGVLLSYCYYYYIFFNVSAVSDSGVFLGRLPKVDLIV